MKEKTEHKFGGVGKTYDLKEKIIELVEKIENPEFLEFLYQMLLSFKEKWGI